MKMTAKMTQMVTAMLELQNAREAKIIEILTEFENDHKAEPRTDEFYMNVALKLAEQGAKEGEVPVGCVIVRNGKILTGDYNGRETFRDALYHAESSAIRRASQILGGWRLVGCTLYVTLEPCPMCSGAIWAARVPKVVIGAKDAKAGSMGSLINLNSYPLNHKPEVKFGVNERACREILSKFFAERRKNKAVSTK